LPEPERRQVLITRPEPDAAETAAKVAALGFEPVVAPVLQILPGPFMSLARFDAVLLTSRNAVPALRPELRGRRVLAVGSATAARAREAGFTDVLDADGDASDLAALAERACAPGSSLLVLHGQGQGGALVATLRSAGFRVRRRVGYSVASVRTFPAAGSTALAGGAVRAALFLSAETARAFVRLLPTRRAAALGEVEALAIGQPAADVLTPLPWRRVRVSVRPTLDHLLGLL